MLEMTMTEGERGANLSPMDASVQILDVSISSLRWVSEGITQQIRTEETFYDFGVSISCSRRGFGSQGTSTEHELPRRVSRLKM